jgi:predicted permease
MRDWSREVLRRLTSLNLPPAREAEIVEEVAQHLEDRFQELLAGGNTEEEARRLALEELSEEDLLARGLRQVEHEVNQEPFVPGGGERSNFLASIWQDVRYGLRMLRKNPGFTAVAVISLGLGIGANTTIFSFVNALLFRPPAVEAPDELLEVWNQNTQGKGVGRYMPLTYPDYLYYRDHNHVFSGLLAFDGDPRIVSWSRSGQGERAQGALVSANFFSVLGVKPALGRTFLAEEDQPPGAHAVVVLSHAFWQQRLGSDPRVLGKTFNFNGTNFTVVGVAPAGFSGVLVGLQPDFWAPLAMTLAFTHDPNYLSNRQSFWLLGMGRLKSGVRPLHAQADLRVLSGQLQQSYPESNKVLEAVTFPATLVPAPFRGYVIAFTGLLMVVVSLVLLIACANAANLLLAQATARHREMAIRMALGAGRGRLIRQMLIESTLVAFFGGCVAFLLASWLAPVLLTLKPPSLPIKMDVPLDWRVLAFTLGVSLATGIVFGIAPALRGAKAGLAPALKDEMWIGSHRKSRLRDALVVAQIAVCSVLLIGAGLCVRSLLNARSIDPGFDTQHDMMAVLDPGSLGYSETKGRAFYTGLLDRVRALPGVASASLAGYLPLTTQETTQATEPEDHPAPPGQAPGIDSTDVGPDYFWTMGMALVRGREFSAQDRPGAPGVAIINEALAKRFWPGQDPIGRRVIVGDAHLEIVGVVRTGKYRTLSEGPLPFLYRPILQNYRPRCTLVVRAIDDPHGLLPAVRHETQAIDPNVVPIDLETMKEYMALPLFPAHTTGLLLSAFGVLALVLAVGGLYGVMCYAVSQRTHEIGVRVALGAERSDVLKLVVGEGMLLTLAGIGVGLAGAFAATRALASLLYGISSTDPSTFVFVPFVLAGVAFAASYIPARRATRVDPMVALRYE